MAVFSLQLTPTADLHLVMGQPGITLKVVAQQTGGPLDVTLPTLGNLTWSTAGIASIAGAVVNPVAVGESVARMFYQDPGPGGLAHFLLLRVKVHTAIQSIWFGNNRATVLAGQANSYQLSVYAKFDDGSIGELTNHPVLNFSSNNAPTVTVDPSGWLSGVAAGSTLVNVTGPGTDHIVVTVGSPPPAANPIVEDVWRSGPRADRRNLLVLAEGFTNTDQAQFDQWKHELVDRLLKSKANSPYNLLAESWNVWAAFQPSNERGVSVGSPVTEPDANSMSTPSFKGSRLLQAKDSRYGMMYGGRPGQRPSQVGDPASPPDYVLWYGAWLADRALSPDPRRKFAMDAYFDTLKNKNVAPGSSEYDIGQTWKSGGPDAGLVALFVCDEADGGAQFGPGFALTFCSGTTFHASSPGGSALDHDAQPTNVDLEKGVATVAHEFAHALGLGDEYEGNDSALHTILKNPDDEKVVDAFLNLSSVTAVSAGGAIVGQQIKWNWDRMTQSSRVMQDVPPPAGASFDVVLKTGEGSSWLKPKADNSDVYLRQRIVDQPVVITALLREGPFKINAVNGDTVTLQGAAGPLGFKKGSVLYIPKKDKAGNIVTLIPPEVLSFIVAKGAFPRADTTCKIVNNDPEDPPSNIPNFHFPRHNHDVVGLYTGGGTWNCGALRPSGVCKMRGLTFWENHWSWWPPGIDSVREIRPFCIVCKYAIVDLVDSGQLALLDKEYPEDC